MSEFKREERYIVVKLKQLAGLQVAPLRNFLRENRVPTLGCVVVESDWPEYEPVWQMIERRMTGQPAVTAAEELDAVLHWRGQHTQAIRERDALQVLLTAADERADVQAWALLEVGAACDLAMSAVDGDERGANFVRIIAAIKAKAALKPAVPGSQTPVLQGGNCEGHFNQVHIPPGSTITILPGGSLNKMCNCNQGRLPCTCNPSAYDGFDNSSD